MVRHLVPGQVDLSRSRDIAVLPTETGFYWHRHPDIYFDDLNRYLLSGDYEGVVPAAEYASLRLRQTLQDSGYFRVVDLSEAKATIQMHIDYLHVEEIPKIHEITEARTVVVDGKETKEKVEVGAEYFLDQKVSLGLTWVVRDKASGRMLASDRVSSVRSTTTQVGKRTFSASGYHDFFLWSSFRAPSVMGMVRSIIDSFQTGIVRHLAPTWVTEQVPLLSIKHHEGAKEAEKLFRKNLVGDACRAYLKIWQEEGIDRAGANAALLWEAQGNSDEALALIGKVALQSSDRQVLVLKERLASYVANHRAAMEQLNGEEP